jgi:hypothetical protein
MRKIVMIEADFAEPGEWSGSFDGADTVVIGQARNETKN